MIVYVLQGHLKGSQATSIDHPSFHDVPMEPFFQIIFSLHILRNIKAVKRYIISKSVFCFSWRPLNTFLAVCQVPEFIYVPILQGNGHGYRNRHKT
jgi:hypothetical protein